MRKQTVFVVLGSFVFAVCLFSLIQQKVNGASLILGIAVIVPQSLYTILSLRAQNKKNGADENRQPVQTAAAAVPAAETAVRIPDAEKPCSTPDACMSSACKSIAVQSCLMNPVISELCSSISHSLSSTTEPISAELLRIRQTSEDFLKSIRMYEDDVLNHTTVSVLQKESDQFNHDLKDLSQTVQDVFSKLDVHITNLKQIPVKIGEVAGDIGEISEQIRILSFNASVEAARAGTAGAGFRVIAGEIKRLSTDTGSRLDEIKNTLRGTKRTFSDISEGLEESRKKMIDVVAGRETGFETFRKMLEDYFPKLEHLYDGVTKVINSLKQSMNVISPVVQLHEITGQEIDNLGRVANDFCGRIQNDAKEGFGTALPSPDQKDAADAFNRIRQRLTTENELNALGRGIRQTVPDAEIDLGVNNCDIELF